MKKLILSLIASLIIIPATVQAQTLEFVEPPKAIELIPDAQANGGWHDLGKVKIRNRSSVDAPHVKVKMYRIQTVDGHNSTFCWTLCYDYSRMGQTFTTPDYLAFAAGQMRDDFYPTLVMDESIFTPQDGITKLHFTFFVTDDPSRTEPTSDSIGYSLTIKVGNTTSVGRLEQPRKFHLSEVFPSPARDIARVRYDVPPSTSKAEVVVYNLLGKTVFRQPVKESRGTVHIPAATLPPGMYISALVVDGNRKQTKRFVVQK